MFRLLVTSPLRGRLTSTVQHKRSSAGFLVSKTCARCVVTSQPVLKKEEVEVTFHLANGTKIKAKGKEGDSLLDIVVNNNVPLDGFGACEGTLTCSTCHLIFKKEDFDRLPDKPTDEELDMLDLAYELTETSRLGCQIIMTKELNGLEIRVPAGHCYFSNLYDSFLGRLGYEVCDENHITPDFKELQTELRDLLFGQDIIIEKLVPILESHFSVQPRKALVISMHGWTGSGKNHATRIVLKSIFKRSESEFVQMFNGLLHFPIHQKEYVDQYKINIQNWVQGNVTKCSRSVFVFDEVDKMPPGVVDSIKPFLDYHEKINSIDYRKAIFIFISNIGAEVINLQYLNLWKKGKSRSDMTYKDFEPFLRSALYNSSGAFRESSILDGHLVSLYLPFLPLQEQEVRKCIEKELQYQKMDSSQYNINMILNELEFNSDTFSTSGCKRISDIVASFKYKLRYQEL